MVLRVDACLLNFSEISGAFASAGACLHPASRLVGRYGVTRLEGPDAPRWLASRNPRAPVWSAEAHAAGEAAHEKRNQRLAA